MIAVLAGSTTLGVVVQAATLVIVWLRVGGRFRLDFRWRGVNLGGASRIAMWTFAIVLIGQLIGLLQTRISALATGEGASLFAISTAWLLFMLPFSVIAVTLGTLYFTRFSEIGATGAKGALGGEVGYAARVLVLAMIGATAAMLAISLPIGRVFTDSISSATAMAQVLAAYLIGLVPLSLLLLTHRAFYAVGNARTPFIYTCVQAAVIVVGTLLVPSILPTTMIAVGVAGVQSVGTCIQAIVAIVLLRRVIGQLGGRALITTSFRALLALVPPTALVVAFGLWAVGPDLNGWAMSSRISSLAGATVIGAVFAAGYGITLFMMRDPVILEVIRRIRTRSS